MSQGGQGQSPMGGSYGGGYQMPFRSRGGYQYQPQMSNEFAYQPRGGLQYQPQQAFNAYNPQPQGAALAAMSNQNVMGFPRQPQMSGEFSYQPKGGLLAAPQDAAAPSVDSAPGFMVNQTQPAQQPQQSFEQFAATLGNNGMTSGQMQDAYQKSLQPQTNFWGNVGPGGTQNPYPTMGDQPFNPAWGKQTFNFDPRSMAGKQVTGDLGWYYGRDAIGRTINNQGDAMAGFSRPADGFQRSRPWFA